MKPITFFVLSFVLIVALFSSCSQNIAPVTAPTITRTGLLAYYPLDGNVGDSSGSGHHGTATILAATIDRFGNANKACLFNGYSSWINLGTWFREPYFTISMWVKPNSTESNYAAIINNIGVRLPVIGSLGWSFQQVDTNANIMSFNCSFDTTHVPTSARVLLTANIWQHVACVKDSSTMYIYVNGTQQDSLPQPGPVIYHGDEYLSVGCMHNNTSILQYWGGALDDIRLYNRALSTDEILALFHEGGWGL